MISYAAACSPLQGMGMLYPLMSLTYEWFQTFLRNLLELFLLFLV